MPFVMGQPRRRGLRLANHDYSSAGAYFVTVCAQERGEVFGSLVLGRMRPNEAGEMVDEEWLSLARRFEALHLDSFVLMPDHVHGIVIVEGILRQATARNIGARVSQPVTLGHVVSAFKSATTVAYVRGVQTSRWLPFKHRLWQRNYYDHCVRNEADLDRVRRYIRDNPARRLP
jgi:REP element-mobilizing transposase RayT